VFTFLKRAVPFIYCNAECHYAECHYSECRGAVYFTPS
jgi:hypothetical protein